MTRAELGVPQPITPERIAAEFPEAPFNIKAVDVIAKRRKDFPPSPSTVDGWLLGMAARQHPNIDIPLVLKAYEAREMDMENIRFMVTTTKIPRLLDMYELEIEEGLQLSKQIQKEEEKKRNSVSLVEARAEFLEVLAYRPAVLRHEAEKEIRGALAKSNINFHGRRASLLLNNQQHVDKMVTVLLRRRAKERNIDIAKTESDLTVRSADGYASVLTQLKLLTRYETRWGRKPETQEFYDAVAEVWRQNPKGTTQSFVDVLSASKRFNNVTFWTVRDALLTMMHEKNPKVTTRRILVEERLAPARKIVEEYKISHGRWPSSTELRKRMPELGDWTSKEVLRKLASREGREKGKPTDQS